MSNGRSMRRKIEGKSGRSPAKSRRRQRAAARNPFAKSFAALAEVAAEAAEMVIESLDKDRKADD